MKNEMADGAHKTSERGELEQGVKVQLLLGPLAKQDKN